MLHATRGPPAEVSRAADSAIDRSAITVALAVVLTVGLASCVGPYNEDGYSQFGRAPGARRNVGYDQRRGDNYRHDPYAAQREWRGDSWWREDSFPRGHNNR